MPGIHGFAASWAPGQAIHPWSPGGRRRRLELKRGVSLTFDGRGGRGNPSAAPVTKENRSMDDPAPTRRDLRMASPGVGGIPRRPSPWRWLWVPLALGGGLNCLPALALEVTRSRDVDAPPAAVWAIVGDFCAIGRWHPQVERCILSTDEDDESVKVQVRGLVVKGGLGTIVEVETARDEAGLSYSYSFVQGPLPVSAYNATLSVRSNGTGSTVIWSGTFDASGATDEAAVADITSVYDAGLAGIARESGH